MEPSVFDPNDTGLDVSLISLIAACTLKMIIKELDDCTCGSKPPFCIKCFTEIQMKFFYKVRDARRWDDN